MEKRQESKEKVEDLQSFKEKRNKIKRAHNEKKKLKIQKVFEQK